MADVKEKNLEAVAVAAAPVKAHAETKTAKEWREANDKYMDACKKGAKNGNA